MVQKAMLDDGDAAARKHGNSTTAKPLGRFKKIAFTLTVCAAFFLLLEVMLCICGVQPVLHREDPFVGFVSSVPLFEPDVDENGQGVLRTAANKLAFFNPQEFAARKPEKTHRVFCVGGSTTFGRPYTDSTSFSGWLRELLPVADPSKGWEVINAGGISYASYRACVVMEELARYDPDLFVVYSGHNEFLEERTYGDVRDGPALVHGAKLLLGRTRTYAALRNLFGQGESQTKSPAEGRDLLAGEVDPILDHAVGPSDYTRNDTLEARILQHYEVSLNRMVDIARQAGAKIVFVTPASNLKDASPFKSEHVVNLSSGDRQQWKAVFGQGRVAEKRGNLEEALSAYAAALRIDDRHAELHYRRGQVLFRMQRFDEAKQAFVRARDEDVCPLRALSHMQETVREVANSRGVPLVDFPRILQRDARARYGHGIPGEEYFLDHVHPTIAVHRLLAVAIVETLASAGIVQSGESWTPAAVEAVAKRVRACIDRKAHARALLGVAKVLSWAGKFEDARPLALRALKDLPDDGECLLTVGRFLKQEGELEEALGCFRRVITGHPLNAVAHLEMGKTLRRRGDPEAAIAHLLMALRIRPDMFEAHHLLGTMLADRGEIAQAWWHLEKSTRINPKYGPAHKGLEALRKTVDPSGHEAAAPRPVYSENHKNRRVRLLAQVKEADDGNAILHGICTRWHENGLLAEFTEYRDATAVPGSRIRWNDQGERIVGDAIPGRR